MLSASLASKRNLFNVFRIDCYCRRYGFVETEFAAAKQESWEAHAPSRIVFGAIAEDLRLPRLILARGLGWSSRWVESRLEDRCRSVRRIDDCRVLIFEF
jgi:hypothetical protein